MTVRIIKAPVGGEVRAVASKSEAHRLLICAALADVETLVGCPERSEDIDATARCLAELGAAISYEHEEFFVAPIIRGRSIGREHSLDCGESGSTLRFLLPVCGALGYHASLHMGGRLPERPLSSLYDEMTSHGCSLSEQGRSPLVCRGQLKSGTYALPGNISSQFVSGLLFALPILEGGGIIRVTGVLESRPYVDITLDALRMFGVTVFEERREESGESRVEDCGFSIPGGQVFRSPKNARAGGDWSNAAFWLALGAISRNGVTCSGLDPDSRQGDRAVVEMLKRFGANVAWESGAVTVSPGVLRGIDIDAGDTPDLVPALAAVACAAEGKTTIYNAGRLRIKESDRLSAIAGAFGDLGADIRETEDGLMVIGRKSLSGGQTQSHGDHRIAMSAAILSAACVNPVEIRGTEAVRKSYPGFFDDFTTALGGEYIES